jgi:DNA sulfur modification protein DndE
METLKLLKARTGITPNILCRLAIMISLEEGKAGGSLALDLEGSEFNAPTLFGDHALAYEALIRLVHGPLESKEVQSVVAGHIEGGLERLKRCKSLPELTDVVDGISLAPA